MWYNNSNDYCTCYPVHNAYLETVSGVTRPRNGESLSHAPKSAITCIETSNVHKITWSNYTMSFRIIIVLYTVIDKTRAQDNIANYSAEQN
jgi:hypothetical protein